MSTRGRWLVLLLALAWLRTLVYLAVIPPWQHYDEPTHFEYVRLLAERGRLPSPGDYDLALRREIAASMDAAGFWEGLPVLPPDLRSAVPPGIGSSELEHPPLYYLFLALPQPLVAHQSVETQLTVARLFSSFLYPLLVAASFGLAAEAMPWRRWLPLAVAAFVAFLPPLTDLASGVNNDVAAGAAATLLLWSAVRLLRRGPSPRRVVATLLLAAACWATKSTAGLVAAVALAVVAASSIPTAARRPAWIGAGVLAGGLLLAACSLRAQPAGWYGGSPAGAAGRTPAEPQAGDWSFVLSTAPAHPRSIVQELPIEPAHALRDRPVTVGAWLRSGGRGSRVAIELDSGEAVASRVVEPGTAWSFVALTTTVPVDATGLGVSLFVAAGEAGADVTVQADAIVLAAGAFPAAEPPVLSDAGATRGSWAGTPFVNLLVNGSAEASRPALKAWVANRRLYRAPAGWVIQSLLDWQRTGWVYGPTIRGLFRGFWGTFAWGHLALPDAWFMVLGVVTVAALAGLAVRLIRWLRAGAMPDRLGPVLALLALVTVVAWAATVLRVHPVLVTRGGIYWPAARYAAVAIAPTAMGLLGGLEAWVPRRWRRAAGYAGLLGMVLLEQVALWWVIVPYYYG